MDFDDSNPGSCPARAARSAPAIGQRLKGFRMRETVVASRAIRINTIYMILMLVASRAIRITTIYMILIACGVQGYKNHHNVRDSYSLWRPGL